VTHTALQQADAGGKVIAWLDKVSDEHYLESMHE
jgi:hypothetical protein